MFVQSANPLTIRIANGIHTKFTFVAEHADDFLKRVSCVFRMFVLSCDLGNGAYFKWSAHEAIDPLLILTSTGRFTMNQA